jgi:hypothetical protein
LFNSSSPRVQHPSFLFGSTSESSLTQTGGLAMGMTEEGEISLRWICKVSCSDVAKIS